MYTLLLSNTCKRSLLKVSKNKKFKKKVFDNAVNILLSGEVLPKHYRNHKLSGEYEGCYECHIQNDILLIYTYSKKELILYGVNIGTHSELF